MKCVRFTSYLPHQKVSSQDKVETQFPHGQGGLLGSDDNDSFLAVLWLRPDEKGTGFDHTEDFRYHESCVLCRLNVATAA